MKNNIKELEKCITSIEQTFLGNTKYNRSDSLEKIVKYKDKKKKLQKYLEKI